MPIHEATERRLSLKEVAVEILQDAAAGRAGEAFARHAAADFRHHNPFFAGDAESLARAMDDNAAQHPQKTLAVQHVLKDGDLVAVHSRVQHGPGEPEVATVHLFRFASDRLVELWDVALVAPPSSPNQHGMF
ncbi:MAG TPA: nuclear transport factor 2 family protein [Thermoanaerobaculia bacterium]|nr:nuclear transport factor 2 family protein [Thermoanaerobaculia bacterium]